MRLSVVIPAYNEAENLTRTLPQLCGDFPVRPDEIIVVDDGSRDDTAAVVQRAAANDARVRLVQLPRNMGKGAAVRAGLAASTSDAVLYTDADLIYHFSDLPRWLTLLEHADVVNGNRRLPDSVFLVPTRLFPYVVKRARIGLLFNAVVRCLLPIRTTDTQSGLKLMRRAVAQRFAASGTVNDFSFDVEFCALLGRWGSRLVDVPVRLDYRDEISRVRLVRDGWRMWCQLWRLRRRLRDVRCEAEPQLTVTADDFGISEPVSRGILEAHTDGLVTATSVMTNMPAAATMVPSLAAHPQLQVGIHLNATAGVPLTSEGQWLADAAGTMSRRHFLWCYIASPRRTGRVLALEWRAQMERLIVWGVKPTHLDSHHHVHIFPGVRRVALALAQRYGIARVRAPLDRDFLCSPTKWPLLWWARTFARMARQVGIAVADHFCGGRLLTATDKTAALQALLSALAPGHTELYCHPGHADPALPDPYRDGRVAELAALKAAKSAAV
ncbi:MAG: ChbG/HpnK family deacetylase [Deltaproteobacteria bacterium]|nr:ChbG/HpnK family deacetylase [Deltaproteobacteria bacterium]